MNQINKNKISFLALIFVLCNFVQAQEVITLQTGWRFSKGTVENAFQKDFNDTKWQEVTIPHDWAIEGPVVADGDGNTGKLPWKGEGWYRKSLEIPASYSGKQVYLLFDGVMAFPEVYVNGILAGKWDYGYSPFYLNITTFLQPGGKNSVAVHADTRMHDSRWYPGAGIYRKVQMIVTNPVHIGIWGIYVTTPIIKPNYADVRIMTTVQNESPVSEEKITVEQLIFNPKGIEISRKSVAISIKAGKSKDVELTIPLTNPQHWDVENPVLYQMKTNIYKGSELTDTKTTSFGIRTIRFTANNGFYLNDKRVQLKGVCLHHDQGALGGAFYPRAMERQLEIMKSMGCNAVRTSHNMCAPELLDLCDKMGILVFNEAFDKYDGKADITEDTDFEEFSARNIKNFVLMGRNHPSVFIWSVGNEIGDVQNNMNNGFFRLQTMINNVRKYDATRPITLVCDDQKSAALRHFDLYDVHSWNYGRRYTLARKLEPGKSVIISESASTLSTRGFYELPFTPKKDDFSKSLQVSSYDLNAPEWAEISDDDFMWQQEDEFVAGEFVWTGFDYLGEPTPYANDAVKKLGMTDKEASRSSYFGIVDLCGIPKDRYYLYKSYWKPDETTVHILPHWNWSGKEGQKIPLFVYTNGDCAELFLNGKSLGKKCKVPNSANSTERFRLMWNDVVYQPGELKAIAYKEGAVLGEDIVKTAGEPFELRLTPDRKKIASGGMDLSYITIEAYDNEGNLCPLAGNKIDITLKGPGRIAGVDNGNPQSMEPFQAESVKLFYGKAMLIVASGFKKGILVITVNSDGLKKAVVGIESE
ncbi:MAG: glycoside hydrolase family 2 TIM barrel-domain containing protein [Bacteroidota bacterium]